MTIEEAVYYLLASDPQVSALVSTRVYPTQAPASAVFPLVIYQEADQQFIMTHDGPKRTSRYSMDLTCWAESYGAAKTVARRVKTRLNGYRGDETGVRILGVFDQTESDDSEVPAHGDERGLFAVSMTLEMWCRAPGVLNISEVRQWRKTLARLASARGSATATARAAPTPSLPS